AITLSCSLTIVSDGSAPAATVGAEHSPNPQWYILRSHCAAVGKLASGLVIAASQSFSWRLGFGEQKIRMQLRPQGGDSSSDVEQQSVGGGESLSWSWFNGPVGVE
ncbi:hypothetical protein JOQ06_006934, partial [Pogonophryne albipinna]